MDFAEVETSRTDEGGMSSTIGKLCGPCDIGNHRECRGEHVCSCADPSHKRQDNNRSPAATAAEHTPEQEAKPQPDDQQGSQPPAPT